MRIAKFNQVRHERRVKRLTASIFLLLSIGSMSVYIGRKSNMAIVTGIISGIIGAYRFHDLEEDADIFLEYKNSSKQIYGKQLDNHLFPKHNRTEPATIPSQIVQPTIQTIDWDKVLADPHQAIVGKSGSGKSVLLQWLIKKSNAVDIKIYDSDAAPNEWGDLQVVGIAGNYKAIGENMRLDLAELERRTKLRAEGVISFPPMIRVLEEAPTTLNELNDRNVNWSHTWLRQILRRGRKYGIKLILISQAFSVKSLKIEGEGELRDNLTVIRLGKVAIAYADPIISELLKEQSRPALVEKNIIGSVPELATNAIADETQTQILESLEVSLSLTPSILDTQTHIKDSCPNCNSQSIKGNGQANGKKRKRCNNCGKSWVL
jgi:hypothetical protein